MSLSTLFQPRPTLTPKEVSRGLRLMTLEGMASNGFSGIITSGFLTAYALAVGATDFQVGILVAFLSYSNCCRFR